MWRGKVFQKGGRGLLRNLVTRKDRTLTSFTLPQYEGQARAKKKKNLIVLNDSSERKMTDLIQEGV